MILDLLYLPSSEELDSINDESAYNGPDSGFFGTFSFPLCVDVSVGLVCGLESGVFIPKVVEYKCDVFAFFVFVPIGVESKGGQLIDMFLCSNS